MVTRPYTHRTNVSGVICMTQQLVLTVPGQTALQYLVTTKTNALSRTFVMPAGMYSMWKSELISKYAQGVNHVSGNNLSSIEWDIFFRGMLPDTVWGYLTIIARKRA